MRITYRVYSVFTKKRQCFQSFDKYREAVKFILFNRVVKFTRHIEKEIEIK